jgi:hypothetical protein
MAALRREHDIGWSRFPTGMSVRVGDGMVHHVVELRGNPDGEDTIVLECGVVVRQRASLPSKEDVDCMACAIKATSKAWDAELDEDSR